MSYTVITGKILVTCVTTGEYDYLLYTDDPDKSIYYLEKAGPKTYQQLEDEDWCPGDRRDLVERYRAGEWPLLIIDSYPDIQPT